MLQRLSDVFNVKPKALEQAGVFDCFVQRDARLHIDPHLLSSSGVPELASARASFDEHFRGVMKLLRASSSASGPFFEEAVNRLTLGEIPSTGLGYAKKNKRGSAIGPKLARAIATLGKAIIDAGVEDPDIFALMGLLQDGVGADRISDMTAGIILPHLLLYSERVVQELNLPSRKVAIGNREYSLPFLESARETMVLVPRDVLRHLPVAESWSDIDTVSSHNAALRARVNSIIGRNWRQAALIPKSKLRAVLLREPELIRDLLRQYKEKPKRSYDLDADPQSLYQWQPVTRLAATASPLNLVGASTDNRDGIVEVVRKIALRFKELVEANRLYRLLHNDDGTPRREKASQLTFFGIADAYCAANDLDLSPETDSGTGPVDFKVSRGYRGRVLVELKLSASSKLKQGFQDQVAAYEVAEQSYYSFYVVMRIDDKEAPVNQLLAEYGARKKAGKPCPELLVIDARPRPSASKR